MSSSVDHTIVGDIEEVEKALPESAVDAVSMTNVKTGLTNDQVLAAREKYGRNEIPAPTVPLYKLFLKQFVGFLPLLIELAAIISLAVQDFVDFGIIAGILFINATLGFREEYHAKKSLDEISNSMESEITVRRIIQGSPTVSQVPTSELVPGDIILLVNGNVVPADVKWITGDVMGIDTAPLTGEPIPRKYPSTEYGDLILSGTTVVTGECYGQVMATGTNTEIGQAQADVLKDKSVQVVSVFQSKVMVVVQLLVSTCLAIVIAVLLVDGFLFQGFEEGNRRETVLTALSILIASIPVALPLVLQVNLALGASFMAKEHNAIVTSIPALQDIASMSMLCSDKTGTLTTANMSIIPDRTYAIPGYTSNDVLLYAALCSNADKQDDPIDKAVLAAFDKSEAKEVESQYEQTEIIGFNNSSKRIVAFVKHGKKQLTIAKGLLSKILDTSAGGKDDHELQWKVTQLDDKDFVEQITGIDKDLGTAGYKTIGIAVCEGNARELKNPTWKFVGLLPMLDPPRNDTAATIASLHHANISVKMITGDHVNVGRETARLIGLGTNIHAGTEIRDTTSNAKKELIWDADGFASVLPSDKREVVMTLRNDFSVVVGMTGDGVNDAPALSAAQVGIAVHGATDAAKNAADLILTEPGLSPIYGAVLESRRIFARIKAYVIYRVAASAILALSLSIIIFATGCAVDSLLVIILALLNDISMIPVAYDNAQATTKPQLPQTGKLVLQSAYYGIIHVGLALLFIFLMSHYSLLEVDLNEQCSAETRGFIWFYLVMVTELTIFSVRAPSFFWRSLPSLLLVVSVLTTCIIGAIIAIFSSELSVDSMGYIVLYNLGAFFLVDLMKVPFRSLINEDPGEMINSDDLISPEMTNETTQYVKKQLRYEIHKEASQTPYETHHVRIRTQSVLDGFMLGDRQISSGILAKKQHGRFKLKGKGVFGGGRRR